MARTVALVIVMGLTPLLSSRSWCLAHFPALISLNRRVCSLSENDLNKPQISSRADAQREAELAQLNGKLYTVAKAEFDKSCPAVATAPSSSVVR